MRTLPVLPALLLLASLAQAATEWPQFHADALHTGAVTSDFAPPRDRWWSQSTGGPIEGSPVVSDGRVFVGSTDGKLYAFDAISGSPLWVFDAGGPISGTPALSGGILYVVTNDGKLFALDAVTGKKRLVAGEGSPHPGATRTSPSIHEGRLYITTEGGSAIAYSLQTLTKDWEYSPTQEKVSYIKTPATNTTAAVWDCRDIGFTPKPIRSSPAVFDDKVFFGSDMHFLFAIDEFGLGGAKAGQTRGAWPVNGTEGAACLQSRIPEVGDVIRASPASDAQNNLVIVPSYDNTVRAYQVTDGLLKWTYNVAWAGRDSRVISTPAVHQGKVYFGSFNGRFYALETIAASPYVRELWNFTAGDAIWSSPAVSNGLVAFGADDETVYVLDASNGQEKWRFRIGGDVRSSPAIWAGGVAGTPIAGGLLYAGGSDGILYAFGGPKPPLPDLLIGGIDYPKDPLPLNGDVDVKVSVRNAGNGSSPATELKLFIDGALASTQPLIALAPGENTTLTYVWHVPQGNHTLRAVVDPAGLSREFDRGNNEFKVETPVAQEPPPPPPPPEQQQEQQPQEQAKPKKKSPGPGPALAAGALALVAVAARVRRKR